MQALKFFSRAQKKFILLSSLSSGLEYYDFVMFIIFAKAISNTFFMGTSWVNMLETFAIFAVGYFGRPLGALIFGHFGDRFGRKKSFLATAILMAFASLGIGLLPGYAHWGLAAPLCLVLLRIVQGISLGGELSGSLIYSLELAPKNQRAFTSSLIFFGVNFGCLLAYLCSYLITQLSTPASLIWSWRIAFIVGGAIGIINFYLRRILEESPIFLKSQSELLKFPSLSLLKNHFKKLLQGIGLVLMGALSNVIVFYMPTYLLLYFQIPLNKVLLINTINIAILSFEQIFLALLADRIGRKKPLIVCALLYLLCSYPLFKILVPGNLLIASFVLVFYALLNGLASSAYPAMLAELFPTKVRYSGFAVSYNFAFSIFSGLTPLILTYLIHVTGLVAIPGIYLSLLSVIALLALVSLKETYKTVF